MQGDVVGMSRLNEAGHVLHAACLGVLRQLPPAEALAEHGEVAPSVDASLGAAGGLGRFDAGVRLRDRDERLASVAVARDGSACRMLGDLVGGRVPRRVQRDGRVQQQDFAAPQGERPAQEARSAVRRCQPHGHDRRPVLRAVVESALYPCGVGWRCLLGSGRQAVDHREAGGERHAGRRRRRRFDDLSPVAEDRRTRRRGCRCGGRSFSCDADRTDEGERQEHPGENHGPGRSNRRVLPCCRHLAFSS